MKTPEDEEFERIEREIRMQNKSISEPRWKGWVGLNGADWNNFNPLLANDPHRVAEWVEKILKERNT